MCEKIINYYRNQRNKILKLKLVPPNYAFKERFQRGDICVDIGTGDDPDFSKYMITNYGLECFAVDPTRKHALTLRELEKEVGGFHYYPYAFGSKDGSVKFFESLDNMSGSLLAGHKNIITDQVISYDVELISMERLLQLIPGTSIAIMKIDIEGAEYDLIENLELGLLKKARQIIIEFHHDTISGITWNDTKKAVTRLRKSGIKAICYNGRDYLFYW